MSIQVSLSLKEIHDALCPECKSKFEELLSRKVSSELIKKALEGKAGG